MKRYNLYIVAFLTSLFLFNACQDEDLVKKTEVVEGIPVTLKLKLGATDKEEITTRAALEKEQENKVYDVFVYVFRKAGSSWEKEHGELFSYSTGNNGPETIRIENNVTSGARRIYAVANAVKSGYATEEALKAVSSLEELEAMTFRMGEPSVNRIGGALLMSGHLVCANQDIAGYYEIPAPKDGNKEVNIDGQIELRHLDSKITFKISTTKRDSVFVPKEWRIIHVPKTSNVLLLDKDCEKGDGDYFNTEFQSFEKYEMGDRTDISTTNQVSKGGSFTFYMMENRKGLKDENKVPANQHEREREQKQAGGNVGADDGKVFEYADDDATYVILKGSFYAYKNGSMELQTSADVTYTVHLGKTVSDFASERNKNYTYDVKVNGVENIVWEVVSGDEERQPGAEGSVVRSAQNVLLDAHYETKCVTFYKDELSNLAFRVKTPYSTGEYNYSTDHQEGDIKDIEWVKFIRNKNASKEYVKYPSEKEQLLTIRDVLEELSEHSNDEDTDFWTWDNDEEAYVVRYTTFVDEFYYDGKPWKEFVNQANREMHILCKTQYSHDTESSLTTSSILLSQRSIKTFYDTNNKGLTTAWGVETINEDEGYEMKYSGDKSDKNSIDGVDVRTNGRYMTFYQTGLLNGSLQWERYVNDKKNENWRTRDGKIKESAEYACFSRNRDLNGDGEIDADEVRWYVPATNQYIGLWIGRDALEPEARLFQADPTDRVQVPEAKNSRSKYHFFSSNGTRFWSEEGASTGSNDFGTHQVTVRCARNLGETYTNRDNATPELSGSVDDYVYVNTDGEGGYHFDLSRVGGSALRSESDGGNDIETHNEHTGGVMNKPYKAFQVNDENRTRCPKGWRRPNQRELVIMLGYMRSDDLGDKNKFIASCTKSDLTFKSGLFYTIATSGLTNAFMTISTSATADTYRCVRDQ